MPFKPMPIPMKQPKETPEGTPPKAKDPVENMFEKQVPTDTQPRPDQPEPSRPADFTPEFTKLKETVPEASPEKTETPSNHNMENIVIVEGQEIEIKPTKLKYFRNKAASGYGYIKAVPLYELLTYPTGTIDKERDGDQLLYDFLVAAFNDSVFVRDHYNELDAEQVDQITKIFGRLNHIDEKEEAARKNREAQVKR